VLDPEIVRDGTTLALIDGNPLPDAPKWIANITARYGIPVGNGEFFFYTDWAYRSRVLINVLYESAEFQSKPWVVGGLKVGYLWDGGKREVSLFGAISRTKGHHRRHRLRQPDRLRQRAAHLGRAVPRRAVMRTAGATLWSPRFVLAQIVEAQCTAPPGGALLLFAI
jgi:hypothetical protein